MQSQLDKLMNEVYKVEKDVSTDCYINSAFNAYYVFKCNFLLSGTFNEQRVCVDFKMESVVLYDPEFS